MATLKFILPCFVCVANPWNHLGTKIVQSSWAKNLKQDQSIRMSRVFANKIINYLSDNKIERIGVAVRDSHLEDHKVPFFKGLQLWFCFLFLSPYHPNVIFEKARPTRYVRAYMLKGTLSDGKTWTGVIRTVKSGRCPARTRVEMTSTQFVQGKRNVCLGMINCFLAAQHSFIEIKCFKTKQRHLGTRFVKSKKLWMVNFIKTY